MVSFVCSSINPSEDFKNHVLKACGNPNVEFLFYENKGKYSLTEIYKKGLKESKYDIVVFLHDDIVIETKQIVNKLVKLYENNPEYGILGVAGTKYMSETGRWWDDMRKMYGKVAHTHEGKTWLSEYSDDLGNDVEEVVIVDGVFFSVHKKRIKETFNKDVKGFHFYDVDFCFRNYLKGVKIGVHTNIRINHKSIGMTNDAWEANRVTFAETFKDNLPVTIKKVLRKNEKLKILIGAHQFNGNSVREQYILEFAKKLKKEGHYVSICAMLGGNLPMMAKRDGINISVLNEPFGYKMGDGKWLINTPNGLQPSQEKLLYKIKNVNFDIIHLFDDNIIEHFNRLYPNTTIVNNQYLDGLFVSDVVNNPVVKKTVQITCDLNQLNDSTHINNVLKIYEEVL